MNNTSLIDPFGRRIHYLRLSVTDRCDFRCSYCMSHGTRFLPRAQLLTLEENLRLARIFRDLGIDRIRVTGGEPLTRRNLPWLLARIGNLSLTELTLTTNGSRLNEFAARIHQAGVSRINVSLDTLDPDRFRVLTGGGVLADTLHGIQTALELPFKRIKINSVILDEMAETESVRLVRFAIEQGCDISFIEQMPLGASENASPNGPLRSSEHIRHALERHFSLIPSTERSSGPSRYCCIAGSDTRVGFISPRSRNFCGDCNRVRVTADGRLLTCLGRNQATDLRLLMRAHPTDDKPVERGIRAAISEKPRKTDFEKLANNQPPLARAMNMTGG